MRTEWTVKLKKKFPLEKELERGETALFSYRMIWTRKLALQPQEEQNEDENAGILAPVY